MECWRQVTSERDAHNPPFSRCLEGAGGSWMRVHLRSIMVDSRLKRVLESSRHLVKQAERSMCADRGRSLWHWKCYAWKRTESFLFSGILSRLWRRNWNKSCQNKYSLAKMCFIISKATRINSFKWPLLNTYFVKHNNTKKENTLFSESHCND